ncbi:hypothetical protein GQ53DRAFT_748901 [Thozetella sp. PMI_491]|nr:hypothetical protein GQ53DRAFT_748901 [Thozetella sp. PMI_491]
MATGKEGNVKWVDGIRGFASLSVVITHIARGWDPDLFRSVSAENAAPRLLQLPILRILVQGRIGVTIFAFVTGYVCALKPVKLCQQGNQEAAYTSMAKSALRRVPRLVLPASIATILIWLLMHLGAFQVAKHCDSWWVGATSPDIPSGSLADSAGHVLHSFLTTWALGLNDFDGNQWTLLPLLKGSLQVYIFMVGTSYVRQRYRMMLSLAFLIFFYLASDAQLGVQFFFGVFMADLQNNESAAAFLVERRRLCRILSATLLFFGLIFMSYPEENIEWASWSRALHAVVIPMVPDGANVPRFATALGLGMVVLGLHFSPWSRNILSNRYLLWFGKQSFAVYLLHGLLLRTVLCWMLYGFHIPPDVQNEKGEWVHGPALQFPGTTYFFVCLLLWIPLNYGAAHLWTTYIDPWCARITERFASHVITDNMEKAPNNTQLLPQ